MLRQIAYSLFNNILTDSELRKTSLRLQSLVTEAVDEIVQFLGSPAGSLYSTENAEREDNDKQSDHA